MKRKAIVLLLAACLFSQNIFAQDDKVISYKKALEIFHSVSNDIKVAQINKNISKRDANAYSSWIPSLSVSSNLVQGAKEFKKDAESSWNWSEHPTFSAGATLAVSAANFTTIIQSQIQNELASFTYDSTIKNLDLALYNTYASLVACKESVNVGKKSLENAKIVYNSTQARFDAGLVSSLELMNAKLTLSRAESNLLNLESARNNVYITLKNMLKVDYDFDVDEMNGLVFLSLPESDELYQKYLLKNDTIKGLSISKKANEIASCALATVNMLPSVAANLNYTYNQNSIAVLKNNLSFTLLAQWKLDGFIPGTNAFTTISNAKDRERIASLNYEAGFSTYKSELERNIDNIAFLEASYNTSFSQLNFAKENYMLTKDAYDKGVVDMSRFSTALESLLNAEVGLISANVNYKKAVYSFASYLGENVENFINTYKKR